MAAEGAQLSAAANWDRFWGRYETSSPERMSGWLGHFASYGPAGARDEDIRFQDTWLRLFQERCGDGQFRMRMVRRADQAQRSWPRAGRERPDGNDETVLEGSEADSSGPRGFWHPYGRGPGVPEARVVCPSRDAHVQVTLRLPTPDFIASKAEAQPFTFLGGVEASFLAASQRQIASVTYRAGDGGGIMFHQASWDPDFVSDVDPEQRFDITAMMAGQEAAPALPADPSAWGLRQGAPGEALTLRYDREGECWEQEGPEAASLQLPPPPSAQQAFFTYPGGLYGLYPRQLSQAGALAFEQGALGPGGALRRCLVQYDAERWVRAVRLESFPPP